MPRSIQISAFEEEFGSSVLGKAEKLLQKRKIQLRERRSGGGAVYTVDKQSTEIFRKGDKLIKSACNCGKKNCEHLAAVLFFLQGDTASPEGKKPATGNKSFSALFSELKNFLKENGRIQKHIAGNTNTGTIKLLREISLFSKTDKVSAAICMLVFFSTNVSGQRDQADVFTQRLRVFLSSEIKKMSARQKNLWHEACLALLKSRRSINAELFLFLAAPCISWIRLRGELDEMTNLLEKRLRKRSNPLRLNLFQIARHMVAIRQKKISGKRIIQQAISPEWAAAFCEMLFIKNEERKAVGKLREFYDQLSKDQPLNFFAFTEYCVECCERLKLKKEEAYYITALLCRDPVISERQVQRLKEILNEKQFDEAISNSIKILKKRDPQIYRRSLLQLMELTGRRQDILAIAVKDRIPFALAQKLVMSFAPEWNSEIFRAYNFQLLLVLGDAREPFHQEEIFRLVKNYLDMLPAAGRDGLLQLLLSSISRNNFIFRLLQDYPVNRTMNRQADNAADIG